MPQPPGYGDFINIQGLKIHVWEAGKGEPIILIHGFMSMAYDWRFNMAELSRQFAVYALDLPGFSYSDKPLDFGYTTAAYSRLVLDYMDARNIKSAILAGNSLGGQVALQAGLMQPDRVGGLVLIDLGGYPGSVGFLPFKLLAVPLLGEMAMSLLNAGIVKMMLKTGIFYNAALAEDATVRGYCEVYKTVNARKIPPMVMMGVSRDEARISASLGEIKCRSLIIWGAEDRVISPHCAGMFARDLPRASMLIVEKAGHMPQVERPEAVNKAIADFANGLKLQR